jgi:hypothetical protein
MAEMVAGSAVSVVETHGCSGTESQKKKEKKRERKENPLTDQQAPTL